MLKHLLIMGLVAILAFANVSAPVLADQLSGNFLAATLKTSKPHRDAVTSLIRGRQGIPLWVLNMLTQDNYIGLASQELKVAGQPMQIFQVCQFKRCEQSSLRVMFTADGKTAFMRIADDKLGEIYLGNPADAVKAALVYGMQAQ